MTDTEAALAGWRQRALDAEGLVGTYRAGAAVRDARIAELERECERLREKEQATRQQAIALIEEAQALMRPQGAWEEEVAGLKAEIVTLSRACAALRLDNAALQKSESEAWDKAEYYEDVVERLVLYFDCPNPSAIVEHIQALFEMRERTLIDLENWIVAAEPLVPFGLPAAFGQWRRPEPTT